MPVLSGFHAGATVSGYARLYLTTDLELYAPGWINNLAYWAAPPSPGAQLLTNNLPVSTTPLVRDGHIVTSYYDDYYNRIHVAPAVIDIGNLLSIQTRTANVWNAWVVPRLLSGITESGTAGIVMTGVTAPTTFAPLEERTISLTVDTQGPATINGLYTFNFAGESPTLKVSGRRVVVFGHPPNWDSPVTETLDWLTDVIQSKGGVEQRIGLRGAPRRALSYRLLTQGQHQTNALETMLMGWQTRIWAVPVWTERQTLAATLNAGSTTIPATTSGYEFTPGGLALLWLAHDKNEAVEVLSVGASSITLKAATVSAWPAGTALYPVRLGRLPANMPLTRETAQHITAEVSFAFEDNPAITPADTGTVYDGYRVYAGRTNWAAPIESEYTRQIEGLDYQTGGVWVDDLSGFSAQVKSWNWLFGTRAEVVAFRAWLAARSGRLVPFWSISQAVDMSVVYPIGASATTIRIRNIGYQRYLNGRADRRHIAIKTVSGTSYYRRILSATEISAAEEDLLIDSALGVLLSPADIQSVRFMELNRFESDSLDINWHTLNVADCSTTLRSLPR